MKSLLLCGLVVLLGAISSPAITLPELEKSYESKCAEILNHKRESLDTLQKSYLGALKRIANKYQRAGRLDEVLLVKKESKDIEDGKWPLSALPEQISLDTSAPRKIYLRKHIEIEQQAAKDLVQTADTMAEALESQIVSLTKSGDLTNAKLAQTIKDDLDKDPDISAARKLASNVRSDGSSRPTLRIRRYGDNIEVLVSYDMRGKVSLDSPVTNVEETDKSIGDTTATSLGEFIGAKDFQVAPYIPYQKSFEDKDLGAVTLTEIIPQFKKSDAGEIGVRLSQKDSAVNPYISLGEIMPPLAALGTVRITCRYFIPNSNTSISGIIFVHNAGSPFAGNVLEDHNHWTDAEIIGQSIHEGQSLLIYLQIPPAKIGTDPSNDYVALQSLKVEHIKFTSFIIERFDENGQITESFKDPASQPKLSSNGELLPQ